MKDVRNFNAPKKKKIPDGKSGEKVLHPNSLFLERRREVMRCQPLLWGLTKVYPLPPSVFRGFS